MDRGKRPSTSEAGEAPSDGVEAESSSSSEPAVVAHRPRVAKRAAAASASSSAERAASAESTARELRGFVAANGGAAGSEGPIREVVLVPLTPGGVEDGRTEVRLPLHVTTQISLGRHSREHPNPWGIRDPRVSRCHVLWSVSTGGITSSRSPQFLRNNALRSKNGVAKKKLARPGIFDGARLKGRSSID